MAVKTSKWPTRELQQAFNRARKQYKEAKLALEGDPESGAGQLSPDDPGYLTAKHRLWNCQKVLLDIEVQRLKAKGYRG